MSDLLSGITSLLEHGWKFFTQTTVPGTDISFAVLTIGLALVSVAFRFLSIMLGHSIGEADFSALSVFRPTAYRFHNSVPVRYRISPSRKKDVR